MAENQKYYTKYELSELIKNSILLSDIIFYFINKK